MTTFCPHAEPADFHLESSGRHADPDVVRANPYKRVASAAGLVERACTRHVVGDVSKCGPDKLMEDADELMEDAGALMEDADASLEDAYAVTLDPDELMRESDK